MRPLTDDTPKPLLKVGGKPLIIWHVERLVRSGIRQLVINHAHLGAQIEQCLGDGAKWGAAIQYSVEQPGSALETGGGIYQALPLLGAEPFLVINGDIWCDMDFRRLRISDEMLAHLVLVENPAHHLQGDFHLAEHGGINAMDMPKLTFSGVGIYRPALFSGCQPGAFPLAPLLRRAMAQHQVSGECYSGQWIDVGTPERLEEINRILHRRQRQSGRFDES